MHQSSSAVQDTVPKTPNSKSLIFTKHVGAVQVGPQQQRQVTLGRFTIDKPAKGFSVDLDPEANSSSVITRVLVSQQSADEYELTLHIANRGSRPVDAEVWQI